MITLIQVILCRFVISHNNCIRTRCSLNYVLLVKYAKRAA